MEGIFGEILQFVGCVRGHYMIAAAATGSAPVAASSSREVITSTLNELLDISKTLTLPEVKQHTSTLIST